MELDETRWPNIRALASVPGRSAPKSVVAALNSIIDGDPDTASAWPSMETTASSTTWSCWIVTERSVGHVRIQYAKYQYDQREEPQREITPSAWSAWVRPLADIVGIRYGAYYVVPSKPTIFLPAEPIKVIFSDGEISIPDGPFPVEDRSTADRIFSRLRASVNF